MCMSSLVDSLLNFIKIKWVITLLRPHLRFRQTIFNISIGIEATNFILHTTLGKRVQVTLTEAEGHR